MNRFLKSSLAATLALALAACAGGPDPLVRANLEAELPDRFSEVTPVSDAAIDGPWWRSFGDADLDALVERGLAYNSDLIIGAARLREAAAVFRQTRSAQLPDVGVFVGGSRQRSPSTTVPGRTDISESGNFGVNVGFEVDLWGRLSAQSDAARQRYLAQGYTQAALGQVIAAELVRGYLGAQALAARRVVLQENVALLEESLGLAQRRFALGAISELDLQRSVSELEDSRAQLTAVEQQSAAARRALLVLAGQMPTEQALESLAVRALDIAPRNLPEVPAGLPSELLERRPDLRAAEANLAAAQADVSAARRALLPSLSLTGSAGSASGDLSDILSGPHLDIWSIGANLVATIFDGGRRRGAIAAAQAREEQLVETYRNTVRNALRETLDALDARTAATQIHEARQAQANALANAAKLADRRYQEGYDSYLNVIDARRSLLSARQAAIEAQRAAGAAHVDLVLALGGGWDGEVVSATP